MWGDYDWPSGGKGSTIFGQGANDLEHDKLVLEQGELVNLIANKLPSYARPANVQAMSANDKSDLPTEDTMVAFLQALGQNTANWSTWTAQLEYQHFIPAYYALVGAVEGVLKYPYVQLPASPSTF